MLYVPGLTALIPDQPPAPSIAFLPGTFAPQPLSRCQLSKFDRSTNAHNHEQFQLGTPSTIRRFLFAHLRMTSSAGR